MMVTTNCSENASHGFLIDKKYELHLKNSGDYNKFGYVKL
jgi:hypothetical protein